jgi:hypothetical protein
VFEEREIDLANSLLSRGVLEGCGNAYGFIFLNRYDRRRPAALKPEPTWPKSGHKISSATVGDVSLKTKIEMLFEP